MISFILLSLFCILLPLRGQGCCAAITCEVNSQCICNDSTNIPTCFRKITTSNQTFRVGPLPKAFYFSPNESQYESVSIFTCFNQNYYYDYALISIFLEGTNGKYSNTAVTLYSTSILSRCAVLVRNSQQFSKKQNGQYQRQLMYMSTTTNYEIELSIYVSTVAVKETKSVIIPIMIGISSFIGTVLVIISVWCIYRRYHRHSLVPQAVSPVNYIQVYMPITAFSQFQQKSKILEQLNCTVCLVDMTGQDLVRKSPCGHIFHKNCIDQWCRKNLNCPLCRFPLDEDALKKHSKEEESHNATQNLIVNQNLMVINL